MKAFVCAQKLLLVLENSGEIPYAFGARVVLERKTPDGWERVGQDTVWPAWVMNLAPGQRYVQRAALDALAGVAGRYRAIKRILIGEETMQVQAEFDYLARPHRFLASACLCGVACRYDGKANTVQEIADLAAQGVAVPICPEVLGGLPTPRSPAEILGERVINKAGQDVTKAFASGAQAALDAALSEGVHAAVLKEKSPSCGVNRIYDGSFEKRLAEGMGLTARLLSGRGIEVVSGKEFAGG